MLAPITNSLPTRNHRLVAVATLAVLVAMVTAFLVPDLVATVQSEGFLAVFSSRGAFVPSGWQWVR